MDANAQWERVVPLWQELTDPFGVKMCECVEWFASIDFIAEDFFPIWSMATLIVADAVYLQKVRSVHIRYLTHLECYEMTSYVERAKISSDSFKDIRRIEIAERVREFLSERRDSA